MENTKTFDKTEVELEAIFSELEEAIVYEPYAYDIKLVNQCVRKNFEEKAKETTELKEALRYVYNLTNPDNPSHFFIRQKCENVLSIKKGH